jgi:hypothetical protein
VNPFNQLDDSVEHRQELIGIRAHQEDLGQITCLVQAQKAWAQQIGAGQLL